jgi:hypothetical protein
MSAAEEIEKLKVKCDKAADRHLKGIEKREAERQRRHHIKAILEDIADILYDASIFDSLFPLWLNEADHADDESDDEYGEKEDRAREPYQEALEQIREALYWVELPQLEPKK